MADKITSDQIEIAENLIMNEFEIRETDSDESAAVVLVANATVKAQSGTVGMAGSTAQLNGGDGDNGDSLGAFVACMGGSADGNTPGHVQISTAGVDGAVGKTLVGVTHPDAGFALEHKGMGAIVNDTNAAPADGAISAGQCFTWFDPANGASKWKFKGKSLDGTVVTGEVALT